MFKRIALILIMSVLALESYAQATVPFITRWLTPASGEIILPFTGVNYEVKYIKESDNSSGTVSNQSGSCTLTLSPNEEYTIEVKGSFGNIAFIDTVKSKEDIIEIVQWGDNKWTSFASSFYGCSNLVEISSVDTPDLSEVSDLSRMFADCFKLTGAGNWDWNVSNITNLSYMFYRTTVFNGDISNWDISNVSEIKQMFQGASSFNIDISNWVTSKITSTYRIFYGASSFNKDLKTVGSKWDVSKVKNMESMFQEAFLFNGDISNWEVSEVTNMKNMFLSAREFNQNIGGWETGEVTTMESMFNGAYSFNQDIGGWDVGKVKTMVRMFEATSVFNQGLNNWDVNNVTDMSFMFFNTPKFNGNITTWDVSNVTKMNSMFNKAEKNVILGNHNLTLTGSAGFDDKNKIVSNGNGLVYSGIGNNETVEFPVGNSSSSYNYVSITNRTGSTDTFSVRALDNAYGNGFNGYVVSPDHVECTWLISKEKPNAGSGVDFVFNWDAAQETNPLTSPTLNHFNSALGKWEIAKGTGSVSGTSLTQIGYDGDFSPFAIGWSPVTPLPVELISFTAIPNNENKSVELSWTTAQELNNDRFEILKSHNGIEWEIIGSIAGKGTKYSLSNYSFVDFNTNEVNYYRLKQVDFDGFEELNNIVLVRFNFENSLPLQLYPNPTQNSISVVSSLRNSYQVIDVIGRVLKEGRISSEILTLNLSDLSKATYIIKVGDQFARVILE